MRPEPTYHCYARCMPVSRNVSPWHPPDNWSSTMRGCPAPLCNSWYMPSTSQFKILMLMVIDGDRANHMWDQQHFDTSYQHPSMYLRDSEPQVIFQQFISTVSSFGHLDMNIVKKGTKVPFVAQTPAIHAVVDTSLDNKVLDSIPGTSLKFFLS